MYTVLIVEDEILVSAGLKSMIQWDDMNMTIVGEARNGKQGLEMYHQMRPDIILTDIKMPVMDGLEMISEIRKEDPDTKIIVLTCYEDFDLVRQAFLLGISDYILKLSMLPDKIEEVVRKVYEELLSSNIQTKEGTRALEQMNQENDAREKCKEYIIHQSGSYEEIQALAQSLQITEAGLVACVMEIVPAASKQQEADTQQTKRVGQIILNLIQNLLSKNKRGEIWMENEKRYLLVLSLSDAQEIEERKALLQDILGRIRGIMHSRLNIEVLIGISSFADSYGELNRLYTEATQALEESVLLDEEQLFYGEPENYQKYENILGMFEEQIANSEHPADNLYQKIMKEISSLKTQEKMNSYDVKDTK